jgi:hypothetical protein
MIGQDKKDKHMDFPGISKRKGGGEGGRGGEGEMGKGEKKKGRKKGNTPRIKRRQEERY